MKEKIAIISILANILLAVGKIIIGKLSNSTAILAEGIHSVIDIFSSIIGYVGLKIAKKPEDKEHPYGHYKFEALASFFITLILLGVGAGIIYEAYQKFLNPSPIQISLLALGIMFVSALVNEIMARLKIYVGKKENSLVLISDGFHSRIDMYESLVVFAGLFLTKYWIYFDSLLAFFIGIYIIKESLSLGKEAVDSLVDTSAGEDIENKIKAIVKSQNIELSSLKTQKKGAAITANLEIKLPSNLKVEEATKISNSLKDRLIKEIENLQYVAIQIISHEVETNYYKPFWGQGFGWQRRGIFRHDLTEAKGQGPEGYCVCPKCGYKILHERGIPCATLQCPNCKIHLERR